MFVIEKDIPLPVSRAVGRPRGSKYPVVHMQVGDSFVVPGRSQKQVSAAVRTEAKKHGVKLSTRKLDGGVRVWRVA